jgi:hypothetical protein
MNNKPDTMSFPRWFDVIAKDKGDHYEFTSTPRGSISDADNKDATDRFFISADSADYFRHHYPTKLRLIEDRIREASDSRRAIVLKSELRTFTNEHAQPSKGNKCQRQGSVSS